MAHDNEPRDIKGRTRAEHEALAASMKALFPPGAKISGHLTRPFAPVTDEERDALEARLNALTEDEAAEWALKNVDSLVRRPSLKAKGRAS